MLFHPKSRAAIAKQISAIECSVPPKINAGTPTRQNCGFPLLLKNTQICMIAPQMTAFQNSVSSGNAAFALHTSSALVYGATKLISAPQALPTKIAPKRGSCLGLVIAPIFPVYNENLYANIVSKPILNKNAPIIGLGQFR